MSIAFILTIIINVFLYILPFFVILKYYENYIIQNNKIEIGMDNSSSQYLESS